MDKYIDRLISTINNVEISKRDYSNILSFSEGISMLVETFTKKKGQQAQIFFIGNGGSAAIASHMTADFMKNGGMNTYCLYDNAVMTCIGNDYGYEYVFSKPLEFLLREDDMLVAISSSGESQNIINAVEIARAKKAEVVTFTGFDSNNHVRTVGNINVFVPSNRYGVVESIHNLILQEIVDLITERDGVEI